MAKEGRNIYRILWNNFINSLKPRQLRGNLVGTDYLGNKYFEVPRSQTSRRSNRWFVPKGGDESKFDESLPAEWESWLRQRRKDPPTEEEIMANLELMKSKKAKAAALEEKFKEHSAPPGKHITFPKFDEYEQHPGGKPGEKTN